MSLSLQRSTISKVQIISERTETAFWLHTQQQLVIIDPRGEQVALTCRGR